VFVSYVEARNALDGGVTILEDIVKRLALLERVRRRCWLQVSLDVRRYVANGVHGRLQLLKRAAVTGRPFANCIQLRDVDPLNGGNDGRRRGSQLENVRSMEGSGLTRLS
jgi:hypothetical protein